MAANAAVSIARLGGIVDFWGRAGDDSAGHAMREMMSEESVNADNFRLYESGRSPVAAIMVDERGERLISTFRGAGYPSEADWLPLKRISAAKVVLADMRWLAGAVLVFEKARALQVPTVLDADLAEPADFAHLLPLTDHAVFSAPGLEQFAPGLSLDDGLHKAREAGCGLAAVTLGEQGCRWLDASGFNECASFPVDVVDTTGAGDTFHGAYAYAIGCHYDAASSMRFAAAAAAMKCRKAGGRAGIPTLAELQNFLQQYGAWDGAFPVPE